MAEDKTYPTDPITGGRLVLEKVLVQAVRHVSERDLATLDLNLVVEETAHGLAATMRTGIFGQRLPDRCMEETKHLPASGWQHVKLDAATWLDRHRHTRRLARRIRRSVRRTPTTWRVEVQAWQTLPHADLSRYATQYGQVIVMEQPRSWWL